MNDRERTGEISSIESLHKYISQIQKQNPTNISKYNLSNKWGLSGLTKTIFIGWTAKTTLGFPASNSLLLVSVRGCNVFIKM